MFTFACDFVCTIGSSAAVCYLLRTYESFPFVRFIGEYSCAKRRDAGLAWGSRLIVSPDVGHSYTSFLYPIWYIRITPERLPPNNRERDLYKGFQYTLFILIKFSKLFQFIKNSYKLF